MEDLLARLEAQATELGFHLRVGSSEPTGDRGRRAAMRLAHGASAQDYVLVFGPDVRLTTLGPGTADQLFFTYTPHVTPKTADSFRRAGVQYLDAAGNAWIHFEDVLIDVRGRPRPTGAAPRASAAGNLFSSGRAQVVLVLLAWPDLWYSSQRDIARAAGVSLGQAHNTLALLAQAGYDRDRHRGGRADLLDLWAAAFPSGLAQRLTLATYRGEIRPVKKVHAGDAPAVSGEAAVPELLRAARLVLYVAELDPQLAIENRWRADGDPNVVVRRKFWHTVETADGDATGIQVAPWPLVYADLLASDDPRAREAAQTWRERHERPR